MFNPENDTLTPEEKFLGNYRGRVIDDNDPLGAGRVRVKVYGVYDGVPDDALPWADFSDPFMGGQAGFGGYIVPDVGSDVWVFFEQGNHMLPVFFAGAPARPHGPSEKSVGPRNKVFRSKAGHVIEIDDSEGGNRIHVHHASGTELTIDNAGNIDELCVGNIKRIIRGNVEEIIEGSVTVTVQGNVSETFDSNFSTTVTGNKNESTEGSSSYNARGDMSVNGGRIDINQGGGTW